MRHLNRGRKLNRTASHRKAMLANIAVALFRHEQITTTLPKAKALRPFVEKLLTMGKKADLLSRRKIISVIQDKSLSKKIIEVLAPRYKERNGGYTRIIKLGNRFGDNAPTAVIEFVDRDTEAKGKDSGPVIEKKPSTETEEQPQV